MVNWHDLTNTELEFILDYIKEHPSTDEASEDFYSLVTQLVYEFRNC